jgi:hypothetical protein
MRFLIPLLLCAGMYAAEPALPQSAKILDQQLSMIERELVPLAEAMPADKYDFAPTQGEFKGVRTFGQQVSHTAAVIFAVAAAVREQKNPSELGKNDNGPEALKTKDEIVAYLKDAFAYAHKAMATITDANLMAPVPSAFGSGKAPRLFMASVAIWHSFDHYGQMVVYARMNGIVPPASRR